MTPDQIKFASAEDKIAFKRDLMLFGTAFVDGKGGRVDPATTTLTPDEVESARRLGLMMAVVQA